MFGEFIVAVPSDCLMPATEKAERQYKTALNAPSVDEKSEGIKRELGEVVRKRKAVAYEYAVSLSSFCPPRVIVADLLRYYSISLVRSSRKTWKPVASLSRRFRSKRTA